MKSQNIYNFYIKLYAFIGPQAFIVSLAEEVLKFYEEVKADLFFTGVTMEFLREAHKEYHGSGDLDMMESLTEDAFKDFAPHLHDPKFRTLFRHFMETSGTSEKQDLFACATNVRLLGKTKNGPAVVTLVVHSYSGLKNLLSHVRAGYGSPYVEEVHFRE